MTVPNEDDIAPAVCDGSSNGLQDLARFSHVAYCSGPAQLAFLLAALDVCRIPSGQCTVLPFPGSAKNDDLKKTLVKACSHLGMKTVDPASMPLPTLSDVHRLYNSTDRKAPVVHWYCQGAPYCRNALHHLQKTLPNIVFEYYDGLGSYTAAFEQEKRRVSLSKACGFSDLRQLSVQRLMRPDMHFMPDDGLWQKCAPPHAQAKTRYVSLSVMLRNIRFVGKVLDDISGDQWPLGKGPDIVLLPSRFAETIGKGKTEDIEREVTTYDHVLGVVRSLFRTPSILVKTHPRVGADTIRRLQEICARHNAGLCNQQQLVEYMLDRSRHQGDVVVIGCWSTALVNTVLFGWGRSFCLSKRFIASYIGQEYADDHRIMGNQEIMEFSGVNMVDSLQQLGDMLRKEKKR